MFYLFLLAHLVADFMLQPYWLVQRKRQFSGLAIHCGIVLGCMVLLPLLDRDAIALWPGMLLITLVHYGADWWKVHHGHHIPGPPIVPFLVDQCIHLVTLAAVLSAILPAEQLWSLHGSPVSPVAAMASGYIAAAFAAPIALMVWLDPRFDHLALAGHARIRSFVASFGVVSLMLFSAALALPAAAVGLAFALRSPRSAHPLDAPFGLVMVVTIAAFFGATLRVLMG